MPSYVSNHGPHSCTLVAYVFTPFNPQEPLAQSFLRGVTEMFVIQITLWRRGLTLMGLVSQVSRPFMVRVNSAIHGNHPGYSKYGYRIFLTKVCRLL